MAFRVLPAVSALLMGFLAPLAAQADVKAEVDRVFSGFTADTPGCAVGADVKGQPAVRAAAAVSIRQMLQHTGGLGCSPDTFSSPLGRVVFRRDASGRVTGLRISQDRVWDLAFVRQQERSTQ